MGFQGVGRCDMRTRSTGHLLLRRARRSDQKDLLHLITRIFSSGSWARFVLFIERRAAAPRRQPCFGVRRDICLGRPSPSFQELVDAVPHEHPGVMPIHSAHEKMVMLGLPMTDVGRDGKSVMESSSNRFALSERPTLPEYFRHACSAIVTSRPEGMRG